MDRHALGSRRQLLSACQPDVGGPKSARRGRGQLDRGRSQNGRVFHTSCAPRVGPGGCSGSRGGISVLVPDVGVRLPRRSGTVVIGDVRRLHSVGNSEPRELLSEETCGRAFMQKSLHQSAISDDAAGYHSRSHAATGDLASGTSHTTAGATT